MADKPEDNPDLEIRPLSEEDLPEIFRYEEICFADPWSPQSFREEIRRRGQGGYSRVLVAGEKLRAYMVAWFVADEAHLANLAVGPDARRKGYATALLADLLHEARRRAVRVVWLEVRVSNLPAIRLYEQHRFQPVAVRKGYYAREREDALVMVRVLGPEGEDDGYLVHPKERRPAGPDQARSPRRNLGQVPRLR
jgi:[ribosomal protein S18]-alanine N-acetyltransferase